MLPVLINAWTPAAQQGLDPQLVDLLKTLLTLGLGAFGIEIVKRLFTFLIHRTNIVGRQQERAQKVNADFAKSGQTWLQQFIEDQRVENKVLRESNTKLERAQAESDRKLAVLTNENERMVEEIKELKDTDRVQQLTLDRNARTIAQMQGRINELRELVRKLGGDPGVQTL